MWRRAALLAPLLMACTTAAPRPPDTLLAPADDLPAWVRQVGARRTPSATRICSANDRAAVGDGITSSTRAIQRAIDDCTRAGGGIVRLDPGQYVTGALFLGDDIELRVDSGVTLLGSQNDADYPVLPTRVAGIEMPWPAALINVNGRHDVRITGRGTIDGRGEKWWDLYWTMRRRDYEPRGLRWAVDYDAKRVRLLVIDGSSDVTVEQVRLRRSGFWTVHVLYSDHVTVDDITISDNAGPSTDGVDIDSSRWVLVAKTDIDNNDDTICLKAGRDADGLRVDRPTEYVVIRDNVAHHGAGVVSFGSETSGWIRHVVALHNRGSGTSAGLILKSARTRGGGVEDVLIRGLDLDHVPTAFSFTLDWNPSYSYARLPADTTGVPSYWRVLATPVLPPERGFADFHDITIEDVNVAGARRIFAVSGLAQKPIRALRWRHVTARGELPGTIAHVRDWQMSEAHIYTTTGAPPEMTDTANVQLPDASRG